MRYWFTIRSEIPDKVGRELWDKISPYGANLTILFDRTDIYGDADSPKVIEIIAKAVVDTGYPVERREL